MCGSEFWLLFPQSLQLGIGKDQGKLGSVQLKLAVSYIPLVKPQNKKEKEKEDPSVKYAFEQFSKTIKDK